MPILEHQSRVTLQTAKGHHICYAGIAPFEIPPKILVWGQRFFKLYKPKKTGRRTVYREEFTAFVADDHVDLRSDDDL